MDEAILWAVLFGLLGWFVGTYTVSRQIVRLMGALICRLGEVRDAINANSGRSKDSERSD